MIRENQRLLNSLNVLTDALVFLAALPFMFWVRFFVMPDGIISVPLQYYLLLSVLLTASHLFCYAAAGMYVRFQRGAVRFPFVLPCILDGIRCDLVSLSFALLLIKFTNPIVEAVDIVAVAIFDLN